MNSKHLQISVFLVYTLVSYSYILFVLNTFGVPVGPSMGMGIIISWVLYCIWSAPFVASYSLFRHAPVRKPLIEEEKKFNELISEILERHLFSKTIRLLIFEGQQVNASAIGSKTIILSNMLLNDMPTDELKGIIAHEFGHLESLDCLIGTAYNTSIDLSSFIYKTSRKCTLLLVLFSVIVCTFTYVNTGKFNFWQLAALPVYLLAFPKLQSSVKFCWRWVCRLREYRQDAFANSIGYGRGLLNFLKKVAASTQAPVNQYEIIMKDVHPMIYNRIRMLEKLVELSDPNPYQADDLNKTTAIRKTKQ